MLLASKMDPNYALAHATRRTGTVFLCIIVASFPLRSLSQGTSIDQNINGDNNTGFGYVEGDVYIYQGKKIRPKSFRAINLRLDGSDDSLQQVLALRSFLEQNRGEIVDMQIAFHPSRSSHNAPKINDEINFTTGLHRFVFTEYSEDPESKEYYSQDVLGVVFSGSEDRYLVSDGWSGMEAGGFFFVNSSRGIPPELRFGRELFNGREYYLKPIAAEAILLDSMSRQRGYANSAERKRLTPAPDSQVIERETGRGAVKVSPVGEREDRPVPVLVEPIVE